MRNFLGKYAEIARVALISLGVFLVAFGVLTTASSQLVVGAAFAFGVAFWKLYDLVVAKNTDEGAYIEVIKLLLASVSTILIAFGIIDNSAPELWIGGISGVVVAIWTIVGNYKK